MATSHLCHGKWRDGPVAACPRHTKLSKPQTNVYRGVGEPGGRGKSQAPKSGGGDAAPAAPSSPKPKPTSGSGSKES